MLKPADGGHSMGLFEQNPILLVPLILIVVVGYDGAKWAARYVSARLKRQPRHL